MNLLSNAYRRLPAFRGKKRLGAFLFRNLVGQNKDMIVSCFYGLKLHLLNTQDSVGRDLFFDGIYESETVNLILELLNDGDVMIDAGANIGAICLPVAKKKSAGIYAFEPAQNIHEILQQNIQINGLRNVFAQPVALSDKEGELDFYESDRVHGWSGPVKIDSFTHYKVGCTTLDEFATNQGIDKIRVLKADVQGWEYFVFKGAERLLKESKIDHILFEFEWWAEKNAGLELGTAQQYLMDHGYHLSTLKGRRVDKPLTNGTVMLHAHR